MAHSFLSGELPYPKSREGQHCAVKWPGRRVWGEQKIMGRKEVHEAHAHDVRDGEGGKVLHVFENVKPEGHEKEVIGWLRENL